MDFVDLMGGHFAFWCLLLIWNFYVSDTFSIKYVHWFVKLVYIIFDLV